jgi:hypothetical protein
MVYDVNNVGNTFMSLVKSEAIENNIFGLLCRKKIIRCEKYRKLISSVLINIIIGLLFYFILGNNLSLAKMLPLDFRMVGLFLFISSYTLNMVQYTVYSSSNYFDTLHSKPISIKTLLFNSFHIHVSVTTILFVISFIYISVFDNQNVLPLISIYLYILGPMAFILFCNILFAQKFNLYSDKSEISNVRTFAQKIIGGVAGILAFGVLILIQLFSTIGCFMIIILSSIIMITYKYWIQYLYKKFMNNLYKIMENLRG